MVRQRATAVIYEDICGDRFARLIEPSVIDGERDFFIPPHITQGALVGDVVTIQIRTSTRVPDAFKLVPTLAKSGKTYLKYAAVEKILEYSDNFCVGHFIADGENGFFVPDDKRIPRMPVFKTKRQNASDGEKVLAKISRKKFAAEYKAAIVKTYGSSELFEANYNATLDAVYGDLGFGEEVLNDVNLYINGNHDTKKRRDFRTKSAITVEGSDDCPGIAYTLEKNGDGFTAYIHYADLDEYVSRGTPLDAVLKRRMRNLRMPHKSVGMLPDKLFNLVSFIAGEDKLAFTLIMEFNSEGHCTSLEMAESVINVTVNGKYSELEALVRNFDSSSTMLINKKYSSVMDMLALMYRFGAILMRKLDDAGAFVGTDLIPSFTFHNDKPIDISETKLCDIQLVRRCFYVATGMAVAEHIGGKGFPLIYQYNPEPSDAIMNQICQYSDISLTKDNLCTVLSRLYATIDAGIAQRTQYIKIYRSVSASDASTEPAWHHMYKTEAFALMPSPLTNFGGLSMIRIYKAYLANNPTLAAEIAEEAVWSYKETNAYHIAIEEKLFSLAMAAYVSYLPYPAEAVVSGISEDEIAITLANGGIGWIEMSKLENAVYDYETNELIYRGNRLRFSSYITVWFDRLNYNECKAYFIPNQ